MKLQSSVAQLSSNEQSVYDFLAVPSNYKQLMLEEVVFDATENSFTFQQKGMPSIALKIKELQPFETVVWESAGGRIAFELRVIISRESAQQVAVCFDFEGDLNPMLTMMVKKPLTALLETFVEKLKHQTF